MQQNQYVIRGGADGRERLRILSRVMQLGTEQLFERVGVQSGWSCLDVGCGGGDVTLQLASLVGPMGRVVGIDIDPTVVTIAQSEAKAQQRTNVSFHCGDASTFVVDQPFDLVYCRFLLTHLANPTTTLRTMMQALKPGGILVIEDIDFAGHFCYPESMAFRQYLDFYTQIVQKRGGDPYIGLRLPTLLYDADCVDIQIHVEQPAALYGEAKYISPLTFEYIADTLVADGLTTPLEAMAITEELYAFARNPHTVMSLPRIIQTWATTPFN